MTSRMHYLLGYSPIFAAASHCSAHLALSHPDCHPASEGAQLSDTAPLYYDGCKVNKQYIPPLTDQTESLSGRRASR